MRNEGCPVGLLGAPSAGWRGAEPWKGERKPEAGGAGDKPQGGEPRTVEGGATRVTSPGKDGGGFAERAGAGSGAVRRTRGSVLEDGGLES